MSYLFELDPAKEASADFIAEVGRKLQGALIALKLDEGLTQSEIARRIGVDRSRVNRCFSGHANITIGTLAEIAWALNLSPNFELVESHPVMSANYYGGCEDNVTEIGIKEAFFKHVTKQKNSPTHTSRSIYEYDYA